MAVRLREISTRAPQGRDKDKSKAELVQLKAELEVLQYDLFAHSKDSVLVVLQGLDASGKDGAIKNVFSGMNPMGISVKAFKKPSEEEAKHDYLWRVHKEAPEKGMIKIFNRSHYEDILVPGVEKWIDAGEIKERMKHLNAFEALLKSTGTHILKFYLHCSDEERLQRLQERQTDPRKKWKYNDGDMQVFEKRREYTEMYERIFADCSKAVKWHIVPSDQNWWKEHYIATEMVKLLRKLTR